MRHRTLSGTVPAPPVGTDLAYTFSAEQGCRLHALLTTLTTSATVANRQPGFQLKDPDGRVCYRVGAATDQVASTIVDHDIAPALSDNQAGFDGVNTQWSYPWPDLWLPPGWSIATITSGLQAGDQWSNITWVATFGEPVFDLDARMIMIEQAIEQMTGPVA